MPLYVDKVFEVGYSVPPRMSFERSYCAARFVTIGAVDGIYKGKTESIYFPSKDFITLNDRK